jgi:hypothetical protein
MATRYQMGNQNLYIEEEQTTQWPQDTKGYSEYVYRRRTDDTMATRYQKVNQNLYIKEKLTAQ